MPGPDHRPVPRLAAVPRGLVQPTAEPTLSDVLAAVQSLASRFDRLESAVNPPRSQLVIDPGEIAETMALLRVARPVPKETPP